jgi:AraC-like DNA-binding protein
MINIEFFKSIDFSFSALSALTGTLFGLYLMLKRKELNYLNILLGFILIISARFIAFSPLFKSNYSIYLENAFLSRPFYFLLAPALFLYVSFRLGSKFSWKRKDFLHLIPFGLFFIDFLVFNFSSHGLKNNLYTSINDNYSTLFSSTVVGLFSSSFFYFSILIQWHIYQLFLISYLFKHLFYFKDLFKNWSLFLILAMSLTVLTVEIRTFYLYITSSMGIPVLQNLFLTINKTACLIFFNSIWLVYLLRFVFTRNEEVDEVLTAGGFQEILPLAKKEKPIPVEEFEALEKKLALFFASSTLYFDSSFNINKLAMEMGVSSNVLTRYFNQFLGMRYNHAINKVRIERLLKMYEEDNSVFNNITMEAIGNMVGFSSKSSFYAAFSKVMFCSPAEYFAKKQIPTA